MNARFVTPDQLAERWNTTAKRVRTRIHQGQLRAMNIGTDLAPEYRIALSEVERYERERSAA